MFARAHTKHEGAPVDLILSLFRTYVHAAVAGAFTYLVHELGLKLPADWSTSAEVVVWGLVVAAFVAGIRWLETRKGSGPLPSLARTVATVLTAGLSRRQPTYEAAGHPGGSTTRRPNPSGYEHTDHMRGGDLMRPFLAALAAVGAVLALAVPASADPGPGGTNPGYVCAPGQQGNPEPGFRPPACYPHHGAD
jgi:hypothetical protein